MRLILSPDPARPTDEWRVDPTSNQIIINKKPAADFEDLFSQLVQAKKASIDATYDGELSFGTPLDKLTAATFTIKLNSLEFPTAVPGSKGKQKPFGLESFKCIIGRPRLGLFPARGDSLTVDLAACAVVADGDRIQDVSSLVEFLLTRRHINVTSYLVDDELVKVELETDA
jgi:hypothetical protein